MQTPEELPDPVEEALLRLLEVPESEFDAEVERLCAGHPDHAAIIRSEIEHARREMQGQTDATPARARPGAPPLPAQIGPFTILAEIGQGGMGTVYLGEQREPVKRRVAVKVIKLGMQTEGVLARFEAERQALALMDHPAIAKVYEAGATADGRPYFAMEYVKGIPITRYCDDHRLSIDERLALFVQVCNGVQHAHQKGVIHRDLSANNVLVTAQDGKPTAKIIDFGLARATDRALTERTLFTELGVILGTPEYMSPEQAGLNGLDIDMRSDVYTLGVLLYELLTGALPFSSEELRSAGYDRMCSIIRTQEPEKPSTKITSRHGTSQAVAILRRTDGDKLLRRLRGDLDWVVLKCLEKDRTRRYATVSQLAEDVQRHLADEPVLARAATLRYRLAKLARRHRGQLLAAAAVLLSLLGGLATATWFWLEAEAQAARAERLASIAETKASEAAANAATAQHHAKRATQSADEALARKREFDQLAGVVHLQRARTAAKELHPPWPETVPALRQWLRDDGDRLLQMQPEIAATLRVLRDRALPLQATDSERDRTSHPRHREWLRLTAKVAALERARRIRDGAEELLLPLPTVHETELTAIELDNLARPLVDRDQDRWPWGQEARALMLARLAWDKSGEAEGALRAALADTLARAWLANGKEREALETARSAVALADEKRRSRYAANLAAIERKVQSAAGEAAARELDALRQQLAALTAEVTARRTYRFTDASQGFLHDALCELERELAAFAAKERPAVVDRLAWAERIESLTLAHPGAPASWAEARAAVARADGVVASASYREHPIDLRPQMGLVPIGMNPVTKLWEFYELRSAWDGTSDPAAIAIPRHVADGERQGHVDVGPGTGIVFVLLPGGTFTMGAQFRDADGAHYDPEAKRERLHRVTLSPFFLARHELTKGQWQRLSGRPDPSWYELGALYNGNPAPVSATHPVEQVDWSTWDELLRSHGLSLPTEAQWEYACRAGSTTTWWTGNSAASLAGAANLLDQHATREYPHWGVQQGDFDDGWCHHAPVGSYRPNRFGLFDVHGNVWEWCADPSADYTFPARAGDGLRVAAPQANELQADRIARGGGCQDAARYAGSAKRDPVPPTLRDLNYGARPARALHQ